MFCASCSTASACSSAPGRTDPADAEPRAAFRNRCYDGEPICSRLLWDDAGPGPSSSSAQRELGYGALLLATLDDELALLPGQDGEVGIGQFELDPQDPGAGVRHWIDGLDLRLEEALRRLAAAQRHLLTRLP